MHAYLDLPVLDEVTPDFLTSSKRFMEACGDNVGNLLFRHALSLQIELNSFDLKTPLEFHRSIDKGVNYQSILFSAANWLGASDLYEIQNKVRSDLILKSKLPVVAIGIGAQASIGDTSLELGAETIKFMEILSSHSSCISVRDQFTADLFMKYGIKNTLITGCPSNFISNDQKLGKSILEKIETVTSKSIGDISISFAEVSFGHPLSREVLIKTIQRMNLNFSQYVGQSSHLAPFYFNETETLPENYLNIFPIAQISNSALHQTVREKLVYFTSMSQWLNSVSKYDIAIGMRIHGIMAAIQSGTPAVLIAHDSRTIGLAKTMCIPYISPEIFLENINNPLFFLNEGIWRDFHNNYDENREFLKFNLRKVLIDNNLTTKY